MGNCNGNGCNCNNGNGCNCNNGNSVGCCIARSLTRTLSNLFSTEPWCGNGNCRGNNNGWNTFENGFVSGVNAANAANDWNNGNSGCGCGCGCGCGSNGDLSSYTACGNQCYDAYFAQQYGLYPFNTSGNGSCSCGCNN